MPDDQMTVSAIAALRGMTEAAARSWVAEQVRVGRLVASGRQLDGGGAKLYRREHVLAAIEAMPGQGSRTDLRSRHHADHDEQSST